MSITLQFWFFSKGNKLHPVYVEDNTMDQMQLTIDISSLSSGTRLSFDEIQQLILLVLHHYFLAPAADAIRSYLQRISYVSQETYLENKNLLSRAAYEQIIVGMLTVPDLDTVKMIRQQIKDTSSSTNNIRFRKHVFDTRVNFKADTVLLIPPHPTISSQVGGGLLKTALTVFERISSILSSNKDTKSNIINIIQYSLFGVIPILILTNAM